MTVAARRLTRGAGRAGLDAALEGIASGAAERDADPAWPGDAFELLAATGALGLNLPGQRRPGGAQGAGASFDEEWSAVRAVARADGSVGRIYDGHLNGVERVAVAAPEPLRTAELEAVAAGRLVIGVWGADPLPHEGASAWLEPGKGGTVVNGVKVFCSGAGGVGRAVITAQGPEPGPPHLAYVDCTSGVEIDKSWFKGAGMRASESHRVVFHGARVLAVLGGPGELVRQPYFGRDAIRTAASWAGMADAAVDAALGELAAKVASRGELGELTALAAGRMKTATGTIDAWLDHAAAVAQADTATLPPLLSVHLRDAITGACRLILDEAARACGSRPFASGGALDRARRDLELFMLQHPLDRLVAGAGRALIERRL